MILSSISFANDYDFLMMLHKHRLSGPYDIHFYGVLISSVGKEQSELSNKKSLLILEKNAELPQSKLN